MRRTACTLVIDARERHVTRHQKDLEEISIEIKQITTADYAVLSPTGEILAAIERKSLEDFAASLKDGRSDNISKLVQLRQKTGCKIIYIIEGPEFPDPNRLFGRMPYRYIESSIFHLIVRDGICIMRTKDSLGTAQTLVRFVRSMDTLVKKCDINELIAVPSVAVRYEGGDASCDDAFVENSIENNSSKHAENLPSYSPKEQNAIALLTERHVKSDHDTVRELWSCFPGISVETADEFSKKWSIGDIITGRANPQEIATFKLASGRNVGRKAVSSLLNAPKLPRNIEVRMLAKIHSISTTTAAEICTSRPLSKLITYGVEGISMIKVGKTQKNLGNVRAQKIVDLFWYKFVPAAVIHSTTPLVAPVKIPITVQPARPLVETPDPESLDALNSLLLDI